MLSSKDAANRELERLRGERAEAQASLEPLLQRAQQGLRGIRYLSPLPPGSAARQRSWKHCWQPPKTFRGTPAPTIFVTLRGKISSSIRGLQVAAAPPPRELTAAAKALFQGDYEEVLGVLEGIRFPGPKARSHALLFQAAARYSLYISGGETEEALLAAARQDVLEYRNNDQPRSPDSKAFSPRFVEFFLAQRQDPSGNTDGEEDDQRDSL